MEHRVYSLEEKIDKVIEKIEQLYVLLEKIASMEDEDSDIEE